MPEPVLTAASSPESPWYKGVLGRAVFVPVGCFAVPPCLVVKRGALIMELTELNVNGMRKG
jgi:hypothetical protein